MRIKEKNDEKLKRIKNNNKENKDDIKNKKDKEITFNKIRVLLRIKLSRLKLLFIF